MNPRLKKIAVPLALVFSLAACESGQDIARKPGVAESLIENSAAKCETGPINGNKMQYSSRLRKILMDTPTKDLERLKDNGITICLDQRLSHQRNDLFDSRIDGIFYNNNSIPVVSLWDDGKMPGESGFFSLKSYDYGDINLENLSDKISDNKVPAQGTYMYSSRYNCGKSCIRSQWRSAPDFDQDSIAKNPELKSPPLRANKSSPGS